jgi:ectoine hydroxylase-related dioxygenase (phytanoyl-CoA dioxygenase family)
MTTTTETDAAYAAAIKRDGFAVVPGALDPGLMSELSDAVGPVKEGEGVHARGAVYAIRNLLQLAPGVKRSLASRAVTGLVQSVLGENAFLVGGRYFNKTPTANWKAPWHQDATITVREKADVVGFGPWTTKAGIQHVQAPPHVLAGLLSLRLHLDDCEEKHGALRVIPGSHNFGRLPVDSIPQFTRSDATVCCVPGGGVLAMKPLLLHASSALAGGGSRRVIHLDFAARPLPQPLEWYEVHRW